MLRLWHNIEVKLDSVENFLFLGGSVRKRAFIATVLLWFATQGISLTYPSARFWDDWLSHWETVRFALNTNPAPWRETIETAILQIWPGLFRVITFIAFPIMGLALWRILTHHSRHLSTQARYWIVVFFLFLPVNSARVAWITFSYSVSLLAFFMAWLILLEWRSWSRLVLVAALFFFSFRTASLISFLLIPLAQSAYLDFRRGLKWYQIVILPSILLAVAAFYLPLIHVIGYGYVPGYISISNSTMVRAFMILLVLSLPVANNCLKLLRKKVSRCDLLLPFGILILGIGVFPYVLTGNFSDLSSFLVAFVPGFSDWDSRHQLLMPLGLALITTGISNYTLLEFRNTFCLVLLVIFSVLGLSFNIEYKVDAMKQQSVIEELRKIPQIKDWEIVVFKDSIERFNARGRSVNGYEKRGWIIEAGGNQKMVVIDAGGYPCLEPVPGIRVDINSPRPSRLRALLNNRVDIELTANSVLVCP